MCTQNKLITIKPPKDENELWRFPIKLSEKIKNNERPKIWTKCGKCQECIKERSRNWTYKIWLESLSYEEKCFITLTYANNEKKLNKEDVQKFMKKLRKRYKEKKIKFFLAGEYGTKKGRPHYHIILLGYYPKDIKKLHSIKSKSNLTMFTSKEIKELWEYGIITVQKFAQEEIKYLSLYINQNELSAQTINEEIIKKRKKLLNKLKVKYKILKITTNENKEIKYTKMKEIKELTKEELYNYKKEANTINKENPLKKLNEFNLYSKNMGFKNYIEKEYYKYDLIIENFKLERPKDYLRKIMENQNKYNWEVITETIEELLKRKKYVDEQPERTEEEIKEKEKTTIAENKNKELLKKFETDF